MSAKMSSAVILSPDVNVIVENKKWQKAIESIEAFGQKIVSEAWSFAYASGGKFPRTGRAEIALFFVDDATIKEINRDYRQIDKPTNVLSFPAVDEGINLTNDMPYLAGDIIVALETTAREAEEAGISLQNHLAHLLIHGVLHLAGFDHIKDDEAEIMESLEVKLMAQMGIKNPYAE